jgi:hypothetical protein
VRVARPRGGNGMTGCSGGVLARGDGGVKSPQGGGRSVGTMKSHGGGGTSRAQCIGGNSGHRPIAA